MKNITRLILGVLLSILFIGNIYALPLKAVLIVGPQEDGTSDAITSMDKIANFLRSKNVIVKTFYGESKWTDITIAANGANFFIYSGHGSTQGGGGKTGGLCISSSSIIPSDKIVSDIKFAPNSMVLFQSVCGGAGSSADDNADIGIMTATTRVTDYAQTFFKSGAACYYANNLGDGCLHFLVNFFDGKNVKECFTTSAETWCKIEKIEPCPIATNLSIGIASKHWGGRSTVTTYTNGVKKVEQRESFKEYEIAFVGNSTFKFSMIK